MYVLGEMLTPDLRVQVLRGATALEMNGLSVRQGGKRGHEIALLPTGSQAVPLTEPLCPMYSCRAQVSMC